MVGSIRLKHERRRWRRARASGRTMIAAGLALGALGVAKAEGERGVMILFLAAALFAWGLGGVQLLRARAGLASLEVEGRDGGDRS